MKSLLYIILLFCSTSLCAQKAGMLDPSFAENGILIDNAITQATQDAVAIQSDNKIVLATTDYYQGIGTFRIDRLLANGSKDLTFGKEGIAFILFPGVHVSDFEGASPAALAILPDGKILAVGGVSGTEAAGSIALTRLNADGSIDTSFGMNGTSEIGFDNLEVVKTIALQPDGKIVAAGYSGSLFNHSYFHIER